MIKDVVRLNSLFDIYGDLLTDNQKQSFYYYYFLDFSLSEISEDIGISKQGVSENLKRAIKELERYEDVLGLYEKKLLIGNLYESLENCTSKELLNKEDIDKCINLIGEIKKELEE